MCAVLIGKVVMQVEATKFTEVGFHGRDVDQIIRDLVDNSILMTKQKLQRQLKVWALLGILRQTVGSLCCALPALMHSAVCCYAFCSLTCTTLAVIHSAVCSALALPSHNHKSWSISL